MRAGDIAIAVFAVVLFPGLFVLMAVLPEHGIVIWLAVAAVLAGCSCSRSLAAPFSLSVAGRGR
jgi:hypothetical protein